MHKNIIIQSHICTNIRDVISYIASEYGLKVIDFSEEFIVLTGDDQKSYTSNVSENAYNELNQKVIRKIQLKINRPSVILVHATSVPKEELEKLGYVYNLTPYSHDVREIAEFIFESAVDHYFKDQDIYSRVA